MGRSEQDLRRICRAAHITTGFPIHGADAEFELAALQEWIRETED